MGIIMDLLKSKKNSKQICQNNFEFSVNTEGGGQSDYLSLSNTKCVKGIFAVFVLIHHLYQHSGLFRETYIGIIFQALGYLSVAMFFFLSGYGVHISSLKKGLNYLRDLPRKRIFPLYVKCLILIMLYILLYLSIGKEISLELILKSITWGDTIITNGWYLQAILVLYILYFIIYGNIKEYRHPAMFAALVVYCLLNCLLGIGLAHYQSIFNFILGIIWAEYKEKVDEFLKKNYFINFMAFLICFSFSFIIGLRFPVMTFFSSVFFVILSIIILMKMPVNCAVTRRLGSYYFEIYVVQGIGMLFFHSNIIYIYNRWLYVAICILSVLLLAMILHCLFKLINKVINK